MHIFTDIPPLRLHLAPLRGACPIVLVPTMGALHDGHRACVDRARGVGGARVVVSIFVNPLQFNASADFDAYPRDVDRDLELCRRWGVDVVFAPGADVMYPEPQRTWVEVDDVAAPLEGAHRPGHFRGVTTVVAKLFHAVGPDIAVFGQKDAQQALVIRRMVRQLDMPVELMLTATVREDDGLAMSSRNARLDAAWRRRAPAISEALRAAGAMVRAGEREPSRVEDAVWRHLESVGITDIDYVAVRSAADLSPLERIDGRVILAVAVRLGPTRLIDNTVFDAAADNVTVDVSLF